MRDAKALIDPDAIRRPFGLAEDLPALRSEWHRHRRPQLLYASEGALRLEAADRLVLLPPARAAWIGAGLLHRVEARRPVRLRTVYLAPEQDPSPGELCVFQAPALLREMAIQAAAWGHAGPELPEMAPFFAALAGLVRRWRERPLAVELPAARSAELGRALEFLLGRLDAPVRLAAAARAGGMSPRTLQRRCQEELQIGLREWLGRARIVRALELLADPGMSVGEVAWGCGYQSVAAFSRAFAGALGSPPSAWRS